MANLNMLQWKKAIALFILVVAPIIGVATQTIPKEISDSITAWDILRIMIVILIGSLGYLISMSINNFIQSWKSNHESQRTLHDLVNNLTMEVKLLRQHISAYDTEIKKIKKRLNKHGNWIHSHVTKHAKCRECPESNTMSDEDTNGEY